MEACLACGSQRPAPGAAFKVRSGVSPVRQRHCRLVDDGRDRDRSLLCQELCVGLPRCSLRRVAFNASRCCSKPSRMARPPSSGGRALQDDSWHGRTFARRALQASSPLPASILCRRMLVSVGWATSGLRWPSAWRSRAGHGNGARHGCRATTGRFLSLPLPLRGHTL